MKSPHSTPARLSRHQLFSVAVGVVGALLLSGCFQRGQSAPLSGWSSSGVVGLSRQVPPATSTELRTPVLGFMPNKLTQSGARLIIERSAQRASFFTPSGKRSFDGVEVAETLKPGSYTVALKQQAPLWYAPDSYFELRGLPVPAEGSAERFRRGALGAYAIFLNNKAPLHTGPHASSEVGGIHLPEAVLGEIFDSLQVGSTVEVR